MYCSTGVAYFFDMSNFDMSNFNISNFDMSKLYGYRSIFPEILKHCF